MKLSTIILTGLLIAVIGFFVWRMNDAPGGGQYDSFAKCLTEKGVVMYGAYWCPHCQNQKKMFGESWDFVSYVECSLPNKGGQTAECTAKGIKGYPTWDINGVMISGELSIETLSEKSGCAV